MIILRSAMVKIKESLAGRSDLGSRPNHGTPTQNSGRWLFYSGSISVATETEE